MLREPTPAMPTPVEPGSGAHAHRFSEDEAAGPPPLPKRNGSVTMAFGDGTKVTRSDPKVALEKLLPRVAEYWLQVNYLVFEFVDRRACRRSWHPDRVPVRNLVRSEFCLLGKVFSPKPKRLLRKQRPWRSG